jgi:hypothetical protein
MDTLKLDGREFTGVTQALTASQDFYILGHLRLAGAMDILVGVGGKRTPEEKGQLLLTQIMRSGMAFYVLAGCYTEVGKKWSRAEADRNALAFAEITDPAEIDAMIAALVGNVINFFSLGEPSSKSSPKSSSKNAKDGRTASAAE